MLRNVKCIYLKTMYLYNQIMSKKETVSLSNWLSEWIEALVNIAMFLPYFFSVKELLFTLFSPWKNIIEENKTVGFSFSDTLNTISFNLISRVIGFFMRFSLLLFYIILQVVYVISIPIVLCLSLILFPVYSLFLISSKNKETRKEIEKERFIKSHILETKNTAVGERWFELYYKVIFEQPPWWKLARLFSLPPLARDWTKGYTPQLDLFSEPINETAYGQDKNLIIGRGKEVEQIEMGLLKSRAANVLLVGDEGVGRHTIIEALARKIYEGRTNPLLTYKRVLRLNMEKILATYTDLEKRENFFDKLLIEARRANNIILVIDDLDKYVTDVNERVNLTGSFEKMSTNANLQIIGTTTAAAYQLYIFPNDKINRYFERVDVVEMGPSEALEILLYEFRLLEDHYGLIIPFETLDAVIRKSDYYINEISFPEKAISLLEKCCIYTKERLKEKYVLPKTVDQQIAESSHIQTTLTADLKTKLLGLENFLRSTIISQDPAMQEVAATIRRSFILIGKRNKPLASFLFLGSTGVGKTQTAKTINSYFFGNENKMLRLDMTTYQSRTDIDKLIGSIKSSTPGDLATQIRNQPYGVLLLDEIEKADKDLINIFMNILDEGFFTDGFGKKVDCKNLIIIATSNAGSDFIYQNNNIDKESLSNLIIQRGIFNPEFMNRFDGIITFKQLNKQDINLIAQHLVKTIVNDIYKLYQVHVVVKPESLVQLVNSSYDERFGVRQMERLLREKLEDEVAQKILKNAIRPDEVYTI